jgi:hypothetical protein
MQIYRIIKLAHRAGSSSATVEEWVIERRIGFFFKRWKEIMFIENGKPTRISHKSHKIAEKYLMENYTAGNGIGSMVTRSGNVYYVQPYSMNYC